MLIDAAAEIQIHECLKQSGTHETRKRGSRGFVLKAWSMICNIKFIELVPLLWKINLDTSRIDLSTFHFTNAAANKYQVIYVHGCRAVHLWIACPTHKSICDKTFLQTDACPCIYWLSHQDTPHIFPDFPRCKVRANSQNYSIPIENARSTAQAHPNLKKQSNHWIQCQWVVRVGVAGSWKLDLWCVTLS